MSINVVAEHMPDGRIRLVKDFGEVPAGFVCDGASIPRFFWRLCGHPYDKIHIRSGVKHDYAYELGGNELMRYAADCDYRDGIRRDGAGAIRSQLEYLSLRIFGAKHFNYLNKRKGKTMKRLIMAAAIAAAALAAGCGTTKSRSFDAKGMYLSETGQLAIGKIHVDAIPEGTDSAVVHYSEDTAWVSDTKTHYVDVILTGTNSVTNATSIVSSLCDAFVAVGAKKKAEAAEPAAKE